MSDTSIGITREFSQSTCNSHFPIVFVDLRKAPGGGNELIYLINDEMRSRRPLNRKPCISLRDRQPPVATACIVCTNTRTRTRMSTRLSVFNPRNECVFHMPDQEIKKKKTKKQMLSYFSLCLTKKNKYRFIFVLTETV